MGDPVLRQSQPQSSQLPFPTAMAKHGAQTAGGDQHLHSTAARRTVPRHQLRCTSMPASKSAQAPVSMCTNMRIADNRQQAAGPGASPRNTRRQYFPALADCHDGMHHMRLQLALSPSSGVRRKPELPHAILASSPDLRLAQAHVPQARSSAASSATMRAYQPAACRPAARLASRPAQTFPCNQNIGSNETAGMAALQLCNEGQWQAAAGSRAGMELDASAAAQVAGRAPKQGLASAAAATGPTELQHERASRASTIACSASDDSSLLRAKTQAKRQGRNGLSLTTFPAGEDHLPPCLVSSCALLILTL